MQQRELTHDVQTLEATELDRLLRQDFRVNAGELFRELLNAPSGIIECPEQPTRWDVIDDLWESYQFVPDPNWKIVANTVFARVTVPTSGILYYRCLFLNCQMEQPTARYAMARFIDEGSGIVRHVAKHGHCDLMGVLVL